MHEVVIYTPQSFLLVFRVSSIYFHIFEKVHKNRTRFLTSVVLSIKKQFKIYLKHEEKNKKQPRLGNDTTDACHQLASAGTKPCLFLKKVDSIFTFKINNSISVRNQLTSLPAEVDLFSWNG